MIKLIIRLTLILLGLFLLSFLIYRFVPFNDKVIDTEKTVYIKKTGEKFNIIRNGEIFYIKGASGKNYLNELSNIGGNTIRVYETENLEVILDSAQINNIAVIVDIYLPKYNKNDDFYSLKENTSKLSDSVQELVNKYKNHPALLFWNLGNEIKYPNVIIKNDFINTFNNLINLIHTIDSNHPVSTSIIGKKEVFSMLLNSPELDLFGFNIFAHLHDLKSDLKKANYFVKPFPYYLSEFGNVGPWEEEQLTAWNVPIEQTSTKKAEQYKNQYESYIKSDKESLGSLAFYWGYKQEYTHTWFNLFDENGRKSQICYSLESVWNNKNYKNSSFSPRIKYMLVDGKGAKDNLMYKPNELKTATLFLEGKVDSTYTYKWNIYKERWYDNDSSVVTNKPLLSSDSIQNNGKRLFTFKTPLIEGPYRLFVDVYDNKGNFATSNTPFYVLNDNE
ncbi:DUF4434 domain-containing protein [Algibacter sp. L1A34]|uniref:DUF4434 domain-containing protein n=1 Tax=Algibacter sp. L1A34 TaxID=2686365 RepID=UPI00131E2117|nr:glycoside hydrolase family 2 TIM barrel-domain containing protein [Algibacter sp. L1A34]